MRARKIPEDPYAFARVSAMRSSLLGKADYDKLLKLQESELFKYLTDHGYGQDMDSALSGSRRVEHAILRNLERTFSKLGRITNPELSALIGLYLERNDLWNIKTVLRAVKSGRRDEAAGLFFAAGSLKEATLKQLLTLESIEAVLKALRPQIGTYSGPAELSAIEDWLTKSYYERALREATELPSEGAAMAQFLNSEVSILNTITLFKLRAAGAKDIAPKLIGPQTPLIKSLLIAQSVESMFNTLAKTEYKHAALAGKAAWDERKSLVKLESSLYRYLLRKTKLLLHQHPVSIDVILDYLFAKLIEAKNLRLIAKGKEIGLPTAFIEEELIA